MRIGASSHESEDERVTRSGTEESSTHCRDRLAVDPVRRVLFLGPLPARAQEATPSHRC